MELLVLIVIWVLFGVICAFVAMAKGRSPIAWFIIGFFAPLLGMILVFVLPDQKAADRRFKRIGKQNRLLRERLRQSQIANRQRLEMLNRRLTAHDRSLNMDTSQSGAAPLPMYEPEPPARRASASHGQASSRRVSRTGTQRTRNPGTRTHRRP